jgi:RNA polymerase sigma-32 factor
MPHSSYLSKILSENPPIPHDKQKELIAAWQSSKDKEALDTVIFSNMRLVSREAWKLASKNVASSFEDLMQEGVAGLLRAAESYDPTKGASFLSYGMMWANAYMKRHMMDRKCIVRLATTRSSRTIFFRVTQARLKAEREGLDGNIKTARIAELLGVGVPDLVEMQKALSGHDSSLNTPIGDESSGITMQDLLVDEETLTDKVEEESSRTALQSAINGALERLSEDERLIVRERFFSSRKKTLRELSSELNISREWARKMEIRALDNIRKTLGREFDIRDLKNY